VKENTALSFAGADTIGATFWIIWCSSGTG